MVKIVRVTFIALVAMLLALVLGSCIKQPAGKPDTSPATVSSTAVPVVESATDVIPGVEDDDSLAATADNEESLVEDSDDSDSGDDEGVEDDDDDKGDEGDDNGYEGGQEQLPDSDNSSGIVFPPPPDERPVDAGVIYSRSCSGCHGDDLGGAQNGPPLQDVAQHYTAAELQRFLDDPWAYAANDHRLIELGRQYGIAMPPAKFSPAELDALAAWLLAK